MRNVFHGRISRSLAAVLAASLCVIASPVHALTEEASSAILQGFAQYQADRVERAILNDFASELADDELSRSFFPKTAASITGYSSSISGQRLLPIVRHYFAKDIESLSTLLRCFDDLDALAVSDPHMVINALLDLRNMALRRPLTSAWLDAQSLLAMPPTPVNQTPQAITTAEQMIARFRVQSNGKMACATAAAVANAAPAAPPAAPPGSPEPDAAAAPSEERVPVQLELFPEESDATPQVKSFMKTVQGARDEFLSAPPAGTTPPVNIFSLAQKGLGLDAPRTTALLAAIADAYQLVSSPPEDSPYTIAVHHLFLIVELATQNRMQTGRYQAFQSSALFLAGVLDASQAAKQDGEASAAAVQALISQFVDDRKAYQSKRIESTSAFYRGEDKPSLVCGWGNALLFCGGNSIYLGSYFGASGAFYVGGDDVDKSFEVRSYGPVGVEAKLATVSGWPIMLGVAPLDIGAYITRELKDQEYDASFEDVYSWSYYLSVSHRNRPYALVLGFQNGIRLGESDEVDAVFLGLGIDLPILTIY